MWAMATYAFVFLAREAGNPQVHFADLRRRETLEREAVDF